MHILEKKKKIPKLYTSCFDSVKPKKFLSVWMCTYPRLKDVLLEFGDTPGLLGNVRIIDGSV